jgi:hypothetical protein
MIDPLRERLLDYITRITIHRRHLPLLSEAGKIDTAVSADSLADALLPFVREELANRPPTQWTYDAACAAAEKHRSQAAGLKAALYALVKLKDGPHDESYRLLSDGAWQRAREVLSDGDH